jgi:hypothetical protein
MDIISVNNKSNNSYECTNTKSVINKEESQNSDCDTVNISNPDIDTTIYKCDNYNELVNTVQKTKGNVMEFSEEISEQFRSLADKRTDELKNYFSKKTSLDDMKASIKETYNIMKSYCIDNGYMDENDTEFKDKLLKQVYDIYRYHAVEMAMYVNCVEGQEIAKNYGASSTDNVDYAYYNADYYYASKEFKDSLKDMFSEFASEENIEEFDTSEMDSKTENIYDHDFNYVWSWRYGMNVGRSSIVNTEQEPPKGLQVFYREMGYKGLEDNSSILSVWYQGEQTEVNVPFEYNSTLKGECYNLLELLDKENSSLAKDDKLHNFLSSFYVYTRGMSALMGDNFIGKYFGTK